MSKERLEDVINTALKTNGENLHVASPATILRFDSVNQRADVKLSLKTKLKDETEIDGVDILNAPVIIASSGSYAITQPINVGDSCLVVFCDKSIDRWKKDGEGFAPEHPRNHDFSDAVIILGVNSEKTKIDNYNQEALEIRTLDNSKKIAVEKAGNLQIISNNVNITIDNDNNINVAGANSINITSDGSKLELPNNGKVKIKNESGNEELIAILGETLDFLKLETSLINRPQYILLSARLNTFR